MKLNLLLPVLLFSTTGTFAQGNNGLVAHWNFNGNANDVSGHNLNGTVTGASLAPGFAGTANTAYYFNGTSSHIDVAYNNLLNLDSLSICALIKPTSFYTGLCQENSIVTRSSGVVSTDIYELSFGDNAYDNDCNVYTLSHEVFEVNVHANSVPLQTSKYANSDTITLNTWYCVTTTYRHDSMRIYVNGTLRKTLYFPDNYVPGNEGLGIGYFSSGVAGGYPFWFNGVIDDIRLYNRPLSASEVMQYCDTAKMLPTSVPIISNSAPEIIIYPNPARNKITIQLPENTGTGSIQLLNTLGQIIVNMKSDNTLINLDISILPSGLYFIKAEYNGQYIFKKLLKN